jgi:hypothetical protein
MIAAGKYSVFGEGIKLFLAGRKVSDAVADARSGNAMVRGVGAVAKGVEGVAGTVVKGAGKTVGRAFSRITSRSFSRSPSK